MPWSYSDLLEIHTSTVRELVETKTERNRMRAALELIASLNGQPTAQDIARMNIHCGDSYGINT